MFIAARPGTRQERPTHPPAPSSPPSSPACPRHLLRLQAAVAGMPSFHGSCAHDHDCEAQDCSSAWSLYQHIDTQRVSGPAEAAGVGPALHITIAPVCC